MRPVNLLPEQYRPHRATGGLSGSAYVVVGLLAVVLLGLVALVVTKNQINDRQSQSAQAKQEISEAEAKLGTLSTFGQFSEVATTRKASVAMLAKGRFDWERYLRELAHVLPADTWLTKADASIAGGEPTTGGEEAPPGAKLEGCAKRQSDVAKLMVRLRSLHAVHDVELEESSRSTDEGASSTPAGEGCGLYYTFKVFTEFTLTPEQSGDQPGAKKVPAKLGGGS